MGLFDIFKKKTPKENKTESTTLESLFNTPLIMRDDIWGKEFNQIIKNQKFSKISDKFLEDENEMKYLNLHIDSNSNNSINHYISSCLENGNGIYISNENKDYEWIFTFGDLIDFHLNETFYSNRISSPFSGEVIDTLFHNEETTIGQPSENYLPEIAKKHITTFLSTFGLQNIKIALIWWRKSNEITLAFEIVPQMFQSANQDMLDSLLYYLKWYLPNYYNIIFIEGNEYFKKI